MQSNTTLPYTLLEIEGNTFTHLDEYMFETEAEARETAKTLTVGAREVAKMTATETIRKVRFQAVRTLESINRNTQPSELTAADLRWLAGEVTDRCDFLLAAPSWAQRAIDSVADRRSFSENYVKHVLAAIRCVLSVERQMERQVARDEAARQNRRKY